MSTKPLVSVGIIAYNQEDLIEETLESALGQDYEPLQVVVADDGSTDATPKILESYQHRFGERLVALTGGQNVGVTGNSNRALSACSGELVALIGGDDLLLPGKVTAQVEWFGDNRERVLCGHDVEHFQPDGTRWLHSERQSGPVQGAGPEVFVANGPIFVASSVMVRRESLPKWGFDERLPVVSDWKLWIDCLQTGGEFGYVPQVLGRYRHHERSVTIANSDECWRDMLVTLALVESEHENLAWTCRRGRALLYRQRGVQCVLSGDRDRAQEFLSLAFLTAPQLSWKAGVWLALSLLPRSFGARLSALSLRLAHNARAQLGPRERAAPE
jgi:glycosyltransferase involved in cell wall biosynthesis